MRGATMLTRDLLRGRLRGQQLEPLWLGHGAAMHDLADRLLTLWRASINASRSEIDDLLPPIIHSSRSQVVARGLNKLISDACEFDEGDNLRERRAQAFDLAAQHLRQNPAANAAAHRAAVSATLAPDTLLEGEDSMSLYGDLPQRARLNSAPAWTPATLIERYNLHLAQGFLLSAEAVTVTLHDKAAGLRRRLIKALRWHRLLATVQECGDGALRFEISGPGSVLDQRSRYGLQLACFLPHLCTASQWQLEATVQPPRILQKDSAQLTLNQQAPLAGHSQFLAHTPPEIAQCAAAWAEKLPHWEISDDPPLLPIAAGELIAPDFRFTRRSGDGAGSIYYLECLHRWHRSALLRRLEQLASGKAPNLLLAVDRALVRSGPGKEAIAHSGLDQRIMLFNDLPTATAVKKLLAAIA